MLPTFNPRRRSTMPELRINGLLPMTYLNVPFVPNMPESEIFSKSTGALTEQVAKKPVRKPVRKKVVIERDKTKKADGKPKRRRRRRRRTSSIPRRQTEPTFKFISKASSSSTDRRFSQSLASLNTSVSSSTVDLDTLIGRLDGMTESIKERKKKQKEKKRSSSRSAEDLLALFQRDKQRFANMNKQKSRSCETIPRPLECIVEEIPPFCTFVRKKASGRKQIWYEDLVIGNYDALLESRKGQCCHCHTDVDFDDIFMWAGAEDDRKTAVCPNCWTDEIIPITFNLTSRRIRMLKSEGYCWID